MTIAQKKEIHYSVLATGAAFVVFNGALKTNLTMNAKQSVIEDGLMIQIDIETMAKLKQTLQSMKSFRIECTKAVSPQANNLLTQQQQQQQNDTIITIEWTKEDNHINTDVFSVIDRKPMVGIKSLRLNNSYDYVNETKAIRWAEIYLINIEEELSAAGDSGFNLNKFSEKCSQGCCIALAALLDDLVQMQQAHLIKKKRQANDKNELVATDENEHARVPKFSSPFKIGLRVYVNKDQVGYLIGMNGVQIQDEKFLASLDNELIQLLHQANSYNMNISLELIFYVQERFNCPN